jgi:Matrixin
MASAQEIQPDPRARRGRFLARQVVFLIFVTAVLINPAPARASNFGSICDASGCVSVANNVQHAVRESGLLLNDIPGLRAAVTDRVRTVYDPLDLVAYVTTTDPLPDVWAHDDNYGPSANDVVAWVDCDGTNTGTGGTHPNRWCRGQIMRFNSYYYHFSSRVYDDDAQRQNVACHELGHTVGLRHHETVPAVGSCMYRIVGVNQTTILNPHDRAHINAYYN